jgi:precorrin-4/cobalt-precorrin-4 C11-methyltransferase
MSLEQTHAFIMEHVHAGCVVARVHTGDPSLYAAMPEQMRLLDVEGVPCEVVPGVTAAFAAAAQAKASFTLPGVRQSLVFTRLPGRTPVPEGERLRDLARSGAALAVYLSGGKAADLTAELRAAGLPEDTPILCAVRVGWPGQRLVWTDLAGLEETARDMDRQAVFLVLPESGEAERSKLYDPGFAHGFRDKS